MCEMGGERTSVAVGEYPINHSVDCDEGGEAKYGSSLALKHNCPANQKSENPKREPRRAKGFKHPTIIADRAVAAMGQSGC